MCKLKPGIKKVPQRRWQLPDRIATGGQAQLAGRSVCIVASPDLRRRWRNYLATNNLHFPVLAPHEISNEFVAQPVDMIRLAKAG